MSTPPVFFHDKDGNIRGLWSPARKRRCNPPLCLEILPSGCGVLNATTWQGGRIFQVLSREEVENWNRNLMREPKSLREGQ
jgi:hypothetical protein